MQYDNNMDGGMGIGIASANSSSDFVGFLAPFTMASRSQRPGPETLQVRLVAMACSKPSNTMEECSRTRHTPRSFDGAMKEIASWSSRSVIRVNGRRPH